MPKKSIESFFETVDDRTHFVVYRGFLRFVLRYLLREKCCDDVHGWDFVEKTFEYYKGTGIAETATTETLIVLLHRFGVVKPLYYCPTVSQRAFKGLEHLNKNFLRTATSVKAFPTLGFVTHFKFQVSRQAIEEVLATRELSQEEV